jgi:hypothetical protein
MNRKRLGFVSWSLVVLLMCCATSVAVAAEKLKPFILASSGPGDLTSTITDVRNALKGAGFAVAGEYSPYADTHIIVVTDRFLRDLAGKQEGGSYLAGQRVSIVREGDNTIQVAYSNPVYFGHAYRVGADLTPVAEKLESALGFKTDYGSKGLTPSKLEHYHYAFGMEYFDEPLTLASYGSQAEAVRAVEKALDNGAGGTSAVYRIDSSNEEVSVFGVALTEGDSADQLIMSTIDVDTPKHAAHLPYEMVVHGGTVKALAPRFRIAISFPGQRMFGENSFMKIMSSPKAIEDALILGAGGELSEQPASRGGFDI